MNNYELHDFIENYACQNDEDIQWKTASRKEFNELISDKKNLEKVDRFFKHQQVFLRYLRQYDRIFNIQATGTGKSGSLINAAEFFKKNNQNIRRVYVIQPGDATKQDFKSQIQKLSDPDEYVNDKLKYSLTKASYNNNLTRLIKEWYTIETYREFAKKKYNDRMIEEEFSDCLFFFDEAHNMRNLSDDRLGEITNEEASQIYDFIWRVCHLSKRSKIVIGTATPMINFSFDFVPLFNLLLPADQQLPINVKKDFYDKVNLKQLEPFFRGKITFIKFAEDKVNVLNQGQPLEGFFHTVEKPLVSNTKPLIPMKRKVEDDRVIIKKNPSEASQPINESRATKVPSFVKLTCLEMIGKQLEIYEECKTKKNKDFYTVEMQAATFVYPNGQFGTKGFRNYTTKNDLEEVVFKEEIIHNRKAMPGLYPQYINENDIEKSLENIRTMSSKFHLFLSKELAASKERKPGNSFCYIEFTEASGANLLGLILNVFGFQEYKNNFSPFDNRSKKIIIPKQKRYFLLTGKSKNIKETLDLFNSKENRHGEYIQILIASELARDGINVKNVRRGYIMTPSWHEAGMYQALSRFIRADSHNFLYEEEGKAIDVEVYRLAATYNLDKERKLARKDFKNCSVDLYLYLLSESKDIAIKRILRFMKQCAFDAFLNYDRNININEEDSCPGADYDKIKFKIFGARGEPQNKNRKGMALNQGPNTGDYIYNTFNLFYSQKDINKIKRFIKNIFKRRKTICIDELKDLLKKESIMFTDYIFNSAIEELIYNKELISNQENTVYYTLSFISDLLFLKRESIFESDKLSTEEHLYLDNYFPYLEKITELKGEQKDTNLKNFYDNQGSKSKEEIKDYYIITQDYLLFKTVLEDTLIRLKNKDLLPVNRIILELLSNYILISEEPEGYLEAARISLSPSGEIKQGRKRAADSKVGLNNLDLDKVKPNYKKGKKLYMHFFKDTGKEAFAVNSIFRSDNREIRILEDQQFREASTEETFVYNYLFNKKIDEILKDYTKSKYYGSIIYRGGQGTIFEKEKQFFRIIDTSNEKNRGKVCSCYGIEELKKIYYYLDTEKKYAKLVGPKIKKPKLCPILINLFKEKKLLFMSL